MLSVVCLVVVSVSILSVVCLVVWERLCNIAPVCLGYSLKSPNHSINSFTFVPEINTCTGLVLIRNEIIASQQISGWLILQK